MDTKQQIARPRGIAAIVSAGFDSTAKHWWLILIPVFLDTFLWLGPRLSFRPLLEGVVAFWQQQDLVIDIGEELALLLELAPRTNMFGFLSIPFIGVPTSLTPISPILTPIPFGVIEVGNPLLWLFLYFVISLVGLLLTAAYLELIALAVRRQTSAAEASAIIRSRFLRRVALTWLQLLGLILVLIIVGSVLYLPLLIVGGVLSLMSTALATFVLFSGPMLGLWVLFYLSFSPHGLILGGRPLWAAAVESVQIVQRNLLSTLGLFLVIILINRVLDMLLALSQDGGWFTAVTILGHAFISTALVVATFIFYRERHRFTFNHLRKGTLHGE